MLNDIFNILLPQMVLICFIIILLVLGMIFSPKFSKYSRLISVAGISLSIFFLSTVQTEPQYFALRNSIMSDSYTLLFDFIILLCGFFVALLSRKHIQNIKRSAYVYHAILLSAILGAISVVSSNDFLTLFVSMELLGFSTYFLFLFGVSYLYGITGSINFSQIYLYISEHDTSILYSIACIFIVLGMISKLAIFPFANWVIDVYKGCESSVLAFLSTIPKLAVFGIVCRLLVFPLSNSFELTFVIAILALITAFWANTFAIRENNIKVILGCSASANASYALLTASLVSVYNLSTVIFYLICYVFMNIGVFAFINIYGDKNPMDVNDFKGVFHKNHGLIGAYAVMIIALAGIPITSGFIAKIYLFSAIANSGLILVPFLMALLLLMVVALFYYLKILLPLFEECDKNNQVLEFKPFFSQKFVLVSAVIITVVIGFFPEILIELCRFIAYNI